MLVLASFVGSFGFAEGLRAPSDAKDYIALKMTYGGFAPVPLNLSHGIKVSKEGEVSYFKGDGKDAKCHTLHAEELAFLVRNISKIKNEPLPRPDLNGGCMDAPNTDYVIRKARSKITIAEVHMCRTVVLPDAHASIVKNALDHYSSVCLSQLEPENFHNRIDVMQAAPKNSDNE